MWIKLSKLFYILLVLYYGWFQIIFFQFPNMLLFLGAGMIGFILLDSLQKRKNIFRYITRELLLWFVFGVTSFIFGLMIAVDYTNLINALSTFFQFLILIWGIVYIANQDGNINFFVDVFTGYSIISALTTLFWGIDYGQGRISMGLSNNPNTLGITMVIGIICILYRLNLKKTGYSILAFLSIMLLIYVSLLTGSRKSVLSIVLLLIYWGHDLKCL